MSHLEPMIEDEDGRTAAVSRQSVTDILNDLSMSLGYAVECCDDSLHDINIPTTDEGGHDLQQVPRLEQIREMVERWRNELKSVER